MVEDGDQGGAAAVGVEGRTLSGVHAGVVVAVEAALGLREEVSCRGNANGGGGGENLGHWDVSQGPASSVHRKADGAGALQSARHG